MGGLLRRLCVCEVIVLCGVDGDEHMTLKCNTQRAHVLDISVFNRWVQFDSDYSDGDDASQLFSTCQLNPSSHDFKLGYC